MSNGTVVPLIAPDLNHKIKVPTPKQEKTPISKTCSQHVKQTSGWQLPHPPTPTTSQLASKHHSNTLVSAGPIQPRSPISHRQEVMEGKWAPHLVLGPKMWRGSQSPRNSRTDTLQPDKQTSRAPTVAKQPTSPRPDKTAFSSFWTPTPVDQWLQGLCKLLKATVPFNCRTNWRITPLLARLS